MCVNHAIAGSLPRDTAATLLPSETRKREARYLSRAQKRSNSALAIASAAAQSYTLTLERIDLSDNTLCGAFSLSAPRYLEEWEKCTAPVTPI